MVKAVEVIGDAGKRYYVCHGYGSERRWEYASSEDILNYINSLGCKPEDEAPQDCYVCVGNKWSSQESDILNDALGVCNYEGDVKKYDGKCYYWPKGEYFVCKKDTWDKANANDIPPGACSNVGAKGRIDGKCYICGEGKKWKITECE